MQNRHLVGLVLAGSIAFAASVIGIAQSAPAPAAPKAAGAPGAPLVILDFKPTLDDLMTMLIQPRHQKLWAAGQQRNWTLAAFQLSEMRAGFDKIAATIPKYTTIDLGPTFVSIMNPQVRALNSAIAARNSTLFMTAFGDLTAACNSCHEALDHGFLVIKVPEVTGFGNQDFRGRTAAAATKK